MTEPRHIAALFVATGGAYYGLGLARGARAERSFRRNASAGLSTLPSDDEGDIDVDGEREPGT